MALPHKTPAESGEGLPRVSPGASPAKVPRPWVQVVGTPLNAGCCVPSTCIAAAEQLWPDTSIRFDCSHWRSLPICSSTCKATFGEAGRSPAPRCWPWAALPLTPCKIPASWVLVIWDVLHPLGVRPGTPTLTNYSVSLVPRCKDPLGTHQFQLSSSV